MKSTHAWAVIAGLALVGIDGYCTTALSDFFHGCCHSNRGAIWVGATMQIVYTLSSLLPGLVAGFLARSRGILTGFLVGLVGGIVRFAFSTTLIPSTNWWDTFSSVDQVVWMLRAGIVLGITCAAAGGAGELLRSNKSLARTRER